jgi:hypothetical protein
MTKIDFIKEDYIIERKKLLHSKIHRDKVLYELRWIFRDCANRGGMLSFASEYDVYGIHPIYKIGVII